MKVKLFSFVKVSDGSVIASVRIARFVSETLQIPLCWDESINDEQLDVLIIVNGAYAFAGNDLLAELGKAIESATRVIWVQNDYTVIPPKHEGNAESPFRLAFRTRHYRGAGVDYWTTVRPMARPGISPSGHAIGPRSRYINWNCLTTEDRPPMIEPVSRDHVVYYGAYREKRRRYFDRYFSAPLVPMVISCPTKKFETEYVSAMITHESKLVDLYDYLSHFGLGLYLEDQKSHVEFHSPANRFYEMLSSHLAMIFQPECMRMMEQAGYEVSEYVAFNTEDVRRLLGEQERLRLEQRARWWDNALIERNMLGDFVKNIWRQYMEEM